MTGGYTPSTVVIEDHKTSVSLEDEFWEGLKVIAKLRVTNLSALVSTIDSQREHANLSSAIRIFVLNFYCNQVPTLSPARHYTR
jgi:predicted DNA-binding ribbon-helix-helix protein